MALPQLRPPGAAGPASRRAQGKNRKWAPQRRSPAGGKVGTKAVVRVYSRQIRAAAPGCRLSEKLWYHVEDGEYLFPSEKLARA